MKRMIVALAIAACTPRVVAKPSPPPPVPALVPPDGPRLPRELVPLGYQVALAFDADHFTGKVAIDAELTAPASVLWLHAVGLEIASARATQGATTVELAATLVPARELLALRAKQPLVGEWVIEVEYRGRATDDGGLVAAGEYLYTQFTPMKARSAVPCIDEPDRKVPWQLTLDVAPNQTVVANAPSTRETTVGDRKRIELARTAPLPSYLVAFAIGPFDIIDAGKTKRGIPIRIAVPPGRRGEAAFAVNRTSGLVDVAEAVLGVAYPYDKLDFVAVPRRSGAHPGIITFEIDLLRGGWLAAMATAIAHQWFGGYVTPRWWDDIWLSEGLASYAGDKMLAALGPEAIEPPRERDDRFVHATRVRPTAQDIATPLQLGSYFSGEASAPVIAWLERYVSPPIVSALLRGFLENHANGVATSDDFVEHVPDPMLRTPLAARLDASVATDPQIDASVTCEGARIEIALAIHDPAIVPIAPACVIYEQDGKPVDVCELLSSQRTITPKTCPAWAVASERTPSVAPMSTPETLFARAWPQLHDSERARALSRAQGELALRMAERMFAVDVTREIAAWHLLQFERFVPEGSRAAFDAKVRTLIGKRAAVALKDPKTVLANPNLLALAAVTGDAKARETLIGLAATNRTRVHPALYFALRVAVRYQPGIAALALEGNPARYATLLRESPEIASLVRQSSTILDGETRLELLSGGCDGRSIEALERTSYGEVPEAIARVRACMKLRDGFAPALAAWLRVRSKR